jgi:hypothetical protein
MFVYNLAVELLGCKVKFSCIESLWNIECMCNGDEYVHRKMVAPYKFKIMKEIIVMQPTSIARRNKYIELTWKINSELRDLICPQSNTQEVPDMTIRIDRVTSEAYLREINQLKKIVDGQEAELAAVRDGVLTETTSDGLDCPSADVIEKTGGCIYKLLKAIICKKA